MFTVFGYSAEAIWFGLLCGTLCLLVFQSRKIKRTEETATEWERLYRKSEKELEHAKRWVDFVERAQAASRDEYLKGRQSVRHMKHAMAELEKQLRQYQRKAKKRARSR